MKSFVKTSASLLGAPFKPLLEALCRCECWLVRHWSSAAHRRLMLVQWVLPPQPEHFDHHIDLFYQWRHTRNPLWVERGVFGSLCLRGGDVLEICCGDGFNARNFYSLRSRRVVACDFDPRAIATARRKNRAPNVDFVLSDIRTAMPEGRFETITWDAAIEHFTPEEIQKIMAVIKLRLTPDGILTGNSIVAKTEGKHLSHHEYEFKDRMDLSRFLTPYFRNVTVFDTTWPTRHSLYFWASDGALPFGQNWPEMIQTNR